MDHTLGPFLIGVDPAQGRMHARNRIINQLFRSLLLLGEMSHQLCHVRCVIGLNNSAILERCLCMAPPVNQICLEIGERRRILRLCLSITESIHSDTLVCDVPLRNILKQVTICNGCTSLRPS